MKKANEKEINRNLKFISILILFSISTGIGINQNNILLGGLFVIVIPFFICLNCDKLIKWIIK